jgi:hypothetical protein
MQSRGLWKVAGHAAQKQEKHQTEQAANPFKFDKPFIHTAISSSIRRRETNLSIQILQHNCGLSGLSTLSGKYYFSVISKVMLL